MRPGVRVAAVVGIVLGAVGCEAPPSVVEPAAKSTSAPDRARTSSVSFPDEVWTVVQQHCVWCHTPAHPTAGLVFTQRTQTLADIERIGYGVQHELAPFVTRLTAGEKSTILDWVGQTTGALPPVTIPATVHWELSPQIAALADGALAPGFAFVVEDGWIDPSVWSVATYTDRFGITARGIALNQTHSVDQSIFSSSRNPGSYLVFKDIPWHGRFHDMRLEGDVRVNRWISVGMQTRDLEPVGRSHRDYVRLQFDRDAICLRSTPTSFETWPWGGSGSSPGADGKLQGTLNASGFYQRNDEWLHFVFTATRVPQGTVWTARVTRRGTGAVVADLQGLQQSSEPLAGTFFLHAYAVGDRRNWANLVFDAQIDPDPTSPQPVVPRPPRTIRPAPEEAPVGETETTGP